MAELTVPSGPMPGGRALVLNAGSATLKATVLDLPDNAPRFDSTVDWSSGLADDDRASVIDAVLAELVDVGVASDSIEVVGHRVVHGGERFVAATRIDDTVVAALDDLAELAPLHNPLAVAAIRAARTRLPAVQHVAAFDTAFHATLPPAGWRYPVPDAWLRDHGIRRYGFHGLSVAWSVGRAAELLDRPVDGLRLVVAHLGGGCSVTAVDGGRSVDTSMGMTPLEGLMMATRAGSIDPGIVFRLLRAGVEPDAIERGLDRDAGLLGIGGSSDMRRLLQAEADGDDRAALAIEMFVRRAAAGIAAAATTLPSLDAVSFTGGIGEHGTSVRRRICERLRPLGVPEPSDADGDAVLGSSGSGVAVVAIHAREDLVIARAAIETVTRG